jgi:putative ABC transport system permease protein
MNAAPEAGPLLAVILAVLTVAAALIVRLGGFGLGKDVLVSSARATVQLAAVSLLIAAVLRHAGWTALFITGMVVVAAGTAGRRITGSSRGSGWWTLLPIVAGVAPVMALLMASTLVPSTPVSVLPIAGIFIGGAMTATGLAGRRALEELRTRHGEYEGGLALGMMPRDVALELCRRAAGLALVPALDQTRTVGLVTLPGAFVGVLLGGADPIEAGATQLLVLIGLLAIEAICATVTLELVATGRFGGVSWDEARG